MSIEFTGQTDVGRQRDHNEDTFLCDAELGLFVLCDGMGGHAAGEVASALAVDSVRRVIAAQRATLTELAAADTPAGRAKVSALIVEAVETACAEVFAAAQADRHKAGMGTTLELVLVVGHVGVMGHVGDSRLYLKRGGEVHQLSEDHSFVREMVRGGAITEEQAKHNRMKNVITRAVGIQETVKVDTLAFDLLPGDTLLLCSDGLSDYLADEAELATLLTAGPVDADAQRLVALANERGGKDNITAVVIRALPDARPERQAEVREIGAQMEVLRKVRLFRHLTYKELVMLLNITTARAHAAGVTVIREGEDGTDCYIVLDGQLQVSQQGKELAVLSSGDHFGEMELIAARPRSATVTTLAATELLELGRDEFIGLLKAHEHLALKLLWSFLQALSVRLHTTNRKLSAALEDEDPAAPF